MFSSFSLLQSFTFRRNSQSSLAEIPAMSAIKSTLARFEQTINSNETSGSTSKPCICNIGKDPAPKNRRDNRGTKKQLARDTSEETITSCLTEDQTVSSIEGVSISHRESSDSFIIGMITEVVPETKYGKDDSMSEGTDKKPAMRTDDERALTSMAWEELEKASMRPHKPQQNIGSSVSLKDRLHAFNASCNSMGGAMEDFEASMSSLNAMVPGVQTKNQVTSDNGTNTGYLQINEAEASNEETDGEKKDRPLQVTWDEQRRLLMSRDKKPMRKTGATMSLKDRRRSFNLSCSSMGGATDSLFGENYESSRVRKVPEMKSEDKSLNSNGKLQATLKESDVGNDDLEDYEASMSSLNMMIPGVQTKNPVTTGNGADTEYQQDTAEEKPSEAKGNAEDKSRNKDTLENTYIETKEIAGSDATEKKPKMRANDDRALTSMTWEELEKASMRPHKPQRKIGASVSLKDRMRSFNASCSSMGGYTDSQFGEDYESNSKGELQATLKESDVGNDDLEDYEASMSSLNAMIPGVQTKNQVTTGNGADTDYQQDNIAEEKPPELKAQKDSPKGNAEDMSRNKDTLENTHIKTKEIRGSDATDKKPKMRANDDRALTSMTWDELEKASMRPHKPQRKIGASVSLKDRMRSFNASCSSMGGATDSLFGEDYESNSKGEVQAMLKESDVGNDDLEDYEASMSSLNAMIPGVQTKNQVTTGNGADTDYQQDNIAEEKPPELKAQKDSPKGDAEDKSRNKDTLENTYIETKNIRGSDATDKKPKMRANDDRALTSMTWEELEKASMRPHKPQRKIGASVSLKDRMRSFNASCSSLGGAADGL
jgi:hypothetical protein